ncbi:MAG: helix-turn-helix transcriptional regulator [Bacteroidetes bacterium]|nr:helix-turn-helix transcriptional regulator [Bacteroidota bacterium]
MGEKRSIFVGLVSVIFLVIVLSGIFIWRFIEHSSASLPREIKENYIAVLPFNNKTGNPDMDALGEMAADWITSGLHETNEGKILSVGEVNRAVEPGISTNHFASNPSLKIAHLIEGSYYQVNDELLFSCSIKDLKKGEIVFTFPMHEVQSKDPMVAIEMLKQKILGYWITKDKAGFERRPPIYEAYRYYLEAGKVWDLDAEEAGRLLQKSIALDSGFHYAAFGLAHSLMNRGQFAKADSIISSYERKKIKLSPMELEFLRGLKARITKNLDQYWKHWHSPYIMSYWGHNHVLKQRTNTLIWDFHQPEKALELLQGIDFSEQDYQKDRQARSLYFRKVDVLCRLGWHKEAIDLLTHIPFEPDKPGNIRQQIYFLAYMKAYQELEEILDFYEKRPVSPDYPTHYLKWFAILGMQNTADSTRVNQAVDEYLAFLEAQVSGLDSISVPQGPGPDEIMLDLYLFKGDLSKAKAIVEKGIKKDKIEMNFLTLAGIYYAKTGQDSLAEAIKKQILTSKGTYDYGNTEQYLATIEVAQGNDDKAIDLLVVARRNGLRLHHFSFEGNWQFKLLFEHPRFQNEVMAAFPLPEIEVDTIDAPRFAFYSPYILVIVLGIFIIIGFFLFFRLKQKSERIPSIKDESKTDDPFLNDLKNLLNQRWEDSEFNLPEISKEMGLSRAQFYRKVKTLTGQSPSVYIRNLRLQKAQELLKSTQLNISEVAYAVGFKDLSYFSRSFSEEFGISPSESRN